MRPAIAFVALSLLATAPASADEPHGCNAFAWDITKVQAMLGTPSPPAAINDRDAGKGYRIALSPLADAHLRLPPERAPENPQSFAGSIEFGPAANEATYEITLAGGAWIDVIQDGGYLQPTAFTGALDCPHVRKSVKFTLSPGPFTVQVSSASTPTIDLAVAPAD